MLAFEKSAALSDLDLGAVTPRYLRPLQGATYTGVSRAKFYEWLSTGQLKSRRIGGCRLIDRLELDRFIAGHPAS